MPTRRRVFTVRRLMLLVVVVACALGWLAGMLRSRREVEGVRAWLLPRLDSLRGDPPLMPVGTFESSWWNWDGSGFRHQEILKAPTGKLISFGVEARSSFFGASSRLEFSSGDRSVVRPIEDATRGRPIDLKAIFPEAFRRSPIVPPATPGGNPSAGPAGV